MQKTTPGPLNSRFNFKNHFARITSLSELYFTITRFLWTMAAAQAAETMDMNEAWPDMRDIYINSSLNPLTKFTSSSRSTKFKDILPWKISQMITKIIPVNMRIVISYAMKRSILLWIWWKVNGNWDNMTRISQSRESHCGGNTSIRRNKSKRAGLWESQCGIQVGKLTNWVRSPGRSVPPE